MTIADRAPQTSSVSTVKSASVSVLHTIYCKSWTSSYFGRPSTAPTHKLSSKPPFSDSGAAATMSSRCIRARYCPQRGARRENLKFFELGGVYPLYLVQHPRTWDMFKLPK